MTDIIKPDQVQHLALQVIDFIANDEDRFGHFLSATGLQPTTVQSKVVSPDLLLSILDYTVRDEALLMLLHKEQHIRPASVMVGCVYLAAEGESDSSDYGTQAWSGSAQWSWLL